MPFLITDNGLLIMKLSVIEAELDVEGVKVPLLNLTLCVALHAANLLHRLNNKFPNLE